MAGSKVIKRSPDPSFFASGGKGHMFGKQRAGNAIAGQSETSNVGGGNWAAGGKGHMFGKGHANPSPSGVSIKESQ